MGIPSILMPTATEQPDGRWKVELVLESHKLRADGEGAEQEVPLHDWLEVGVYGEEEGSEPLYLQWHRIEGERSELSVVVDQRPARAGIDPRVLFVDREPDDNLVRVELGG